MVHIINYANEISNMNAIDVVCLMVFNVTFNNISVISWRSVLLVKETGGPGENHRTVASHWETLSHNVVHLALIEIRSHNISGCIGSGKSNYHMISRRPLNAIEYICKWTRYKGQNMEHRGHHAILHNICLKLPVLHVILYNYSLL